MTDPQYIVLCLFGFICIKDYILFCIMVCCWLWLAFLQKIFWFVLMNSVLIPWKWFWIQYFSDRIVSLYIFWFNIYPVNSVIGCCLSYVNHRTIAAHCGLVIGDSKQGIPTKLQKNSRYFEQHGIGTESIFCNILSHTNKHHN